MSIVVINAGIQEILQRGKLYRIINTLQNNIVLEQRIFKLQYQEVEVEYYMEGPSSVEHEITEYKKIAP